MKPCLVIAAREQERETVLRHWPHYKAVGLPIIGATPWDSVLKFPDEVPVIYAGKSGHHGKDALERITIMYRSLLGVNFSHYALLEYDCLVLRPDLEFHDVGIGCCLMLNNDPLFTEKKYPHGLWTMSRETMAKLLETIETNTDVYEHGHGDRFIARIASIAKIPLRHEVKSYSRNSLDTPETMKQAREALKNGVKWIHGIKDQAMFDTLLAP